VEERLEGVRQGSEGVRESATPKGKGRQQAILSVRQ
jgi:hypothetical protein